MGEENRSEFRDSWNFSATARLAEGGVAGVAGVQELQNRRTLRASSLLLEHGALSGISVIIHGRAKPYGVLEAHTTRQRNFTPDDIHFLQSVASILAAAIERRALEEELLSISRREQRRMGQDLHDGLCQQLAGIEFKNSVLVQQLTGNLSPNPRRRQSARYCVMSRAKRATLLAVCHRCTWMKTA
jgi:signal transduction histidine kinase